MTKILINNFGEGGEFHVKIDCGKSRVKSTYPCVPIGHGVGFSLPVGQ